MNELRGEPPCHPPLSGHPATPMYACMCSSSFYEYDASPYCEGCYRETFSPRCARCAGAILDVCALPPFRFALWCCMLAHSSSTLDERAKGVKKGLIMRHLIMPISHLHLPSVILCAVPLNLMSC